MILFLDDEELRTRRYREQLAFLGEVRSVHSADEALPLFGNPDFIQKLKLAVIDLGMYTGRDMSERATEFGKLTGYVLRQNLRKVWPGGAVIFLTCSPDENIRDRIEREGDYFCRKPHTTPMQLHCLALGILSKK